MIRNVEEKDMRLIMELTEVPRYDVEFCHSAINFDENGNLKAIILTSDKALIDSFPKKRFPRNKWFEYLQWCGYKKENNHQIIYLYRSDRNGYALNATLMWLVEQISPNHTDLWWTDSDSAFITKDNLNKICLFPIPNTTKYFFQ